MLQRIAPITKNLLILNVLFFAAKYVFAATQTVNLDILLGAFYPLSDNFKSHQVLSHMFMHGDFMHFFFNMFALYMFGSNVEQILGDKKYIILYFGAGLGAFLLFNLTNYISAQSLIEDYGLSVSQVNEIVALEPFMVDQRYEDLSIIYSIPMMGASGAIFGVLVAFGMLFPNAVLMLIFPPIPLKAKYFIPIYIVIELYFAVANNPGDNVAHYAHLGGALIGFILVRIWKKNLHQWN